MRLPMIFPRPINLRLLRWVRPGDLGVLDLPGAATVWMATTFADFDPLLDAQNRAAKGGPGAGGMIFRLASAGRIRVYPTGIRVVVREVRNLSIEVQVTHGDRAGEVGWVQREFFKPACPACVPCGSRDSSSS